jgi:hypothetical protein
MTFRSQLGKNTTVPFEILKVAFGEQIMRMTRVFESFSN